MRRQDAVIELPLDPLPWHQHRQPLKETSVEIPVPSNGRTHAVHCRDGEALTHS